MQGYTRCPPDIPNTRLTESRIPAPDEGPPAAVATWRRDTFAKLQRRAAAGALPRADVWETAMLCARHSIFNNVGLVSHDKLML